jgi:hypothetical protein
VSVRALGRVATAALLTLALGACGGDATGGAAASSSAGVPAMAAPTSSATPRDRDAASCDVRSAEEHYCLEYRDPVLASERERACAPGLKRGEACPARDRLGACRLPDNSVRWAYPPKTPEQHEKACRASFGKWATGEVAPLPDPATTLRCEGKYDGVCEEETSYTGARTRKAEEECSQFGGRFSAEGGCPRTGAVAICDLDGPRSLVVAASAVDARSICDKRAGRYQPTAEAAAAASASASASSAAEAQPPEAEPPEPPKADVILRTQ